MPAKHDCKKWTYYGGMASCPHGYELFPDGSTRKSAEAARHNKKVAKPKAKAKR